MAVIEHQQTWGLIQEKKGSKLRLRKYSRDAVNVWEGANSLSEEYGAYVAIDSDRGVELGGWGEFDVQLLTTPSYNIVWSPSQFNF